MIYFYRNDNSTSHDPPSLRLAMRHCLSRLHLEEIVLVDGGGDSLILRVEDASEGSETTDPFEGGDAATLASVTGLGFCSQAIVSVGLDVKRERFDVNLEELARRGGYGGSVNPVTGEVRVRGEREREKMKKSCVLSLFLGEGEREQNEEKEREGAETNSREREREEVVEGGDKASDRERGREDGLKVCVEKKESDCEGENQFREGVSAYLQAVEPLLVLEESHLNGSDRTLSHTAVITFHAMSGEKGLKRTFVEWEPVGEGGERGVRVDESHQWVYFVDPTAVEELKMEYRDERERDMRERER